MIETHTLIDIILTTEFYHAETAPPPPAPCLEILGSATVIGPHVLHAKVAAGFLTLVRNYQYLLEVERHVLSHLFHFSIAGIILDYQNYTYIHVHRRQKKRSGWIS